MKVKRKSYRPRFPRADEEKWKLLINTARNSGIDNALRILSGGSELPEVEEPRESRVLSAAKDKKGENLSADLYSTNRVKTVQELMEFHEVDQDKWEEERLVTNYWEVGCKVQIGTVWQIVTEPLHQLKVTFKRKVGKIDVAHLLESMQPPKELPQGKSAVVAISTTSKAKAVKDKVAIELMVTDFHLGKIGFDPHTLEFNWSLEKCKDVLADIVTDTLDRFDPSKIDHFILPVGNDFYNIDSEGNMTTAGTPQMTAHFWQQLFAYGCGLNYEAIRRLKEVAPVYVYMIPGNHDRNSVFSLGEVMKARFHGDSQVIVDNSYSPRKWHQFGAGMVGYSHGDHPMKNLFSAASLDRPQMFAATKHRAIHTGHLHKNKVTEIVMKDEEGGVEIEICPSLSPMDMWHYKNLYIGSMRRSKAFVWDKGEGIAEEIYFKIK